MAAGRSRDLIQTSVWLPRDLHRTAKSQAILHNTTIRQLIEDGLRQSLRGMAYEPEESGL